MSNLGWILIFYSTVIQFCIAYVCWFAALARLPASVAAIGTMAVPVIGVVASAVALHEPLGIGADRGTGVHAGRRRAGDAVMTRLDDAGRALRISPLGLVFLAIASVGWGLNFPIMKHLLTEWPPLSSRGLCGMVGAAALALMALARRQRLSVPPQLWLRLVLVSMLTIGGWVAFMGLALLWLNASEAAVLGISIPVWVVLLAWPILGERFSPARAVALTIALAGIAVLIGGNGIDASLEKLPGLLCALAGAVCVALGTVLTKHFPLAMPPLSLAAWQIGIGCLPVAVGRACGRAAAARGAVTGRLGVDDLYDADPVLPLLCVLVRRTGAIAGGDSVDRHAAGAGGRRAGGGRDAARAAGRARNRRTGVHAWRRRAGAAVMNGKRRRICMRRLRLRQLRSGYGQGCRWPS